MIEPGHREDFVADGHDEASSSYYPHWRTPSGQVLREGRTYTKEWALKFRTVRISGHPDHATWSLLRYKGGWEVVSEAHPELSA